jgi:DNA-binding response OmpR family regulator
MTVRLSPAYTRTYVPGTVLCVDAPHEAIDLLQQMLRREGYAVKVAQSGVAALQMVQTDPPDLAILEVDLPDMDGFSLCARLHAAYCIPVILLTARAREEDVVAGFQHGADDYVTKPYSPLVLLQRLRAVLGRRQRLVTPPTLVLG